LNDQIKNINVGEGVMKMVH